MERVVGDGIHRTCRQTGPLGRMQEREETCMKPRVLAWTTGWVRKAFTELGDPGREAGLGVGRRTVMPIWDVSTLTCPWDGCWKLPEKQRNMTTTTICKVVQFVKYIICISFDTIYTLNKITIRLESSDKYTQKVK